MTFKITLQPGNHSFTAEPDETLLDAGLKHGYVLPYGCRNGVCGACKGRILKGAVEHGSYHGFILTEDDIAQGLTLFCAAYPRSDVTLECPEPQAVHAHAVKTLPCRVQKMGKLAPDVMLLCLKLPANERLNFTAGQYIDILQKDGAAPRSFSLANAPHDDEFLQLHVRLIPGGAFTEHVFGGMRERDILRLTGPLGGFWLQDTGKPVIFVASGTGFAPIKSIIEHALHIGMQRPMHLYWGARTLPDLYLLELAQSWAAAGITFTPVLSEPRAEDGWEGRAGFVHEAVMQDYPDLSGHEAYVSGAPVVVEAAHRDFTATCRLPEDAFFSDAFTFTASR